MKKSSDSSVKMALPSILAFSRCIETSDAMFFGRNDIGELSPVQISDKTVRGTQSNYGQDEKSIKEANLQRVDAAMLAPDQKTLVVRYSVKAIGPVGLPSSCNNTDFSARLVDFMSEVMATRQEIFLRLAEDYVANIVNGRVLWRNALAGENISTKITVFDNKTLAGNEICFAASAASETTSDGRLISSSRFSGLVEAVAAAFKGEQKVMLEVETSIFMGRGAEVYPSQEFAMEKSSSKDAKSKILYNVNKQAAFHSQKVGNALRIIDRSYPGFNGQAISVEPFGSVTNMAEAHRLPATKKDFYTLFENAVLHGQRLEDDDMFFLLACLIRGGVYGGKSEKDNAPVAEKEEN